MSDDSNTYMVAMLWTCTSCGFLKEGGQPKMECPFCEAYKTSFIDIPQHLEKEVREAHCDLPFNHRDCRKMRLELMEGADVHSTARRAGRVLPSAAGNWMDPSTDV